MGKPPSVYSHRCCYLHFGRAWLQCRRPATLGILEDRVDLAEWDRYTESCARHAVALLGSVSPDGFNWTWTVWALDPEADTPHVRELRATT